MRVRGNLVTTRSEHVPLFVFAPHIETHHDRKSLKLSNSPCYDVHLWSFLSFRFVRLTMCRHLISSLRHSAVCCRSSGVVLSQNCATLGIRVFWMLGFVPLSRSHFALSHYNLSDLSDPSGVLIKYKPIVISIRRRLVVSDHQAAKDRL